MGACRALSLLGIGIAVRTASAVRTDGEVLHFGFPYQSCLLGDFTDNIDGSVLGCRTSSGGNTACEERNGVQCEVGDFGPHLGVVLDPALRASNQGYALTGGSTAASLVGSLTGGFTLELWVKPAVPTSTENTVLVSLSDGTSAAGTQQNCAAEAADPKVSFELLQKPSGCLVLHVKLMAAEGILGCSGTSMSTHMLPSLEYCNSTLGDGEIDGEPGRFSFTPDNPGLDLVNPKLQHVVVSVSSYLGGTGAQTSARGGQNDAHRFAIYVDNVLKTSDTITTNGLDGDLAPKEYQHVRKALQSAQRSVDVSNNLVSEITDPTFVPSTLWDTTHTLRVGHDGTASTSSQWKGEVLMLAMYPHPLSDAQVQANYDAQLDNTAPFAEDIPASVPEGLCSALPELTATDWDNQASSEYPNLASSAQTLTYRVDPSLITRGAVYSDDQCSTALPAGVQTGAIYFKPSGHEYSSGEPGWGQSPAPDGEPVGTYATLPWNVSDGNGGSHSAVIRINVTAVNDEPVAGDNHTDVFLELPKLLYINGTDLDGDDATDRLKNCKIRLDPNNMPQNGDLYQVQSSGSGELIAFDDTATPLTGNAETVPNALSGFSGVVLWYKSDSFATDQTDGNVQVATDSFKFRLIDSSGAESESQGTFNIGILSGLQAEMMSSSACTTWMNYPPRAPSFVSGTRPCSWMVDEEVLSVVELRGLNQNEGDPVFRISALPSNGTLYQFTGDVDDSGNPVPGAMITAVDTTVLDPGSTGDDLWHYSKVLYQSNVDFFNWPEKTYDGTDLNPTVESFNYTVGFEDQRSAQERVVIRVRNVNDAPILTAPLENITFVLQTPSKPFGGITIEDADRGLGYYRIELLIDGSSGYVTETANLQPGTQDASWDKWQASIGNVAVDLIGYCPLAVCSSSVSGVGCSSLCTRGADGSQEKWIQFFATPQVLRTMLANLEFYSLSATDNKMTITIQDIDDGEGPMGGELGAFGSGNNANANPATGSSPASVLTVELEVDLLSVETIDGDNGGGSAASSNVGSQDGIISYLGAIVAFSFIFCFCCIEGRRQMARTARRNRWGERVARELRTRDMRLIVPFEALLCFGLMLILILVRCNSSPRTFYAMDLNGDGECSDDILAMHNSNNSNFKDNGECIAGVPQGFMTSKSMLPGLMLGLGFPLIILEVEGRAFHRSLTAAVALAWLVLLAIVSSLFTAWDRQIPEDPWIAVKEVSDDTFEVVLGKQWTVDKIDGVEENEMLRPEQSNAAFAIFFIQFTTPIAILITVAVAAAISKVSPDEDSSSSDSEEERRKRRKGKKGHDSRHKKKKKKTTKDDHKGKSKGSSEKRRKDDESSEDDSESERSERPAARKKPAPPPKSSKPAPPPRKPPPPSGPPAAPKLTYHASSGADKSLGASIADSTEWHYMDSSNQQMGPVTAATLQQMFEDGVLHASTYVWCEDMDTWKELKDAPLTVKF